MIRKTILFRATDDIQEFVNAASKCEFEIDLQCGRAIVDAKSFLGVMSLGLSRILTVTYGGENGRFERILNKYAVA